MKKYETRRLVLKSLDKIYAEQVLNYFLRNKTFLKKWEPDNISSWFEVDDR